MNFPTHTGVVQAAGGLVLRRRANQLQVVLVHRPVHQDWSFPKGKLEEGETFADAAQREVLEETGLACRIVQFVGHTEYIDRKDRPKVVAYWVMTSESGTFLANDEVDEISWVDVPAALERLTYERDRDLLSHLSADGQLDQLA